MQRPGGGGIIGASAPPLFVPGEKMPFFGNESNLFSWNRSAVLAKLKCHFWSVPPHYQGASAASYYTCQSNKEAIVQLLTLILDLCERHV